MDIYAIKGFSPEEYQDLPEEDDMMTTIRTAEDLEARLIEAWCWQDPAAWEAIEDTLREAQSFADRGLLTRDRGVILRFENGAEFQLTIVRSERPSTFAFDCPECSAEDEDEEAFAKHLVTAHEWDLADAFAEVAQQQDRQEGGPR